jgi:predicted tellurium resistance membrane protein TerC
MIQELFTPENLTALATLTAMEIVLGIDNVIFIAILVARIPVAQQAKARLFGLSLALILRVILLCSISWVMGLTKPLIEVATLSLTGRDIILLLGGLFLVAKSTMEIHHKVNGENGGPVEEKNGKSSKKSFGMFLFQIAILDLVFSLDSVITAVGMVQSISIMIIAVILSMGVMIGASGAISRFVDEHPTIKVLALSFLILIGVMLIVEGTGGHVGKGYIYFAMAFSLTVELLNIRVRKRFTPAGK